MHVKWKQNHPPAPRLKTSKSQGWRGRAPRSCTTRRPPDSTGSPASCSACLVSTRLAERNGSMTPPGLKLEWAMTAAPGKA